MKVLIGILGAMLISLTSFSQVQKYWVFFKKKETKVSEKSMHVSNQTLENRRLVGLPLLQNSDLPVSQQDINSIRNEDAQPIVVSKWLNAISAELTPQQVSRIKSQPNVSHITPIRYKMLPTRFGKMRAYGTAIDQMEAEIMAQEGLNGEGIIVGVIDAGFYGAKSNKYLKELFKKEQILGARDWVNPQKTDHYGAMETYMDNHGTNVLKMLAGKKGNNEQAGFAHKSKFYLARTDHGDNEFRGEEDYWVAAMEWMDSLGVRIINTSLGYALGFDDPEENYSLEDMDGKSSVVSKAAQIAADEKGILIVVSAGNEGSDPGWRIVSTPADAKGVISVGATDPNGLKMGYSSIGPEALSYLKPNVSCYSLGGTSFSAPVITGFAACLLQKKPTATNVELTDIIEKSAQLYPYGNNFIGYGIPKSSMALSLIQEKIEFSNLPKKVSADGKNSFVIKVKDASKGIVFHKKDERNVLKQDFVKGEKGKFEVIRPEGAQFSSVIVNDQVYEIVW